MTRSRGRCSARASAMVQPGTRRLLSTSPASVRLDKATGRIVTTFSDNPQLPVSGVEALVQVRSTCAVGDTGDVVGSEAASTLHLTSWGGQSTDLAVKLFTIDCTPGLGGFAPTMTAGTVNPVGGAFSPFALSDHQARWQPADQRGVRMELPTGLLAQLKGNLNTQVGTVKAYAGPGSNPYMLPGKVFLEGRYGDAPFSLRVVVPAKAGPFDLGEVVVRQKIYVDPIDAHVTVVSDPIPTIVAGVPVRLQRLDVSVDKPRFIINPTSCAAKAITGTFCRPSTARPRAINTRFQVGELRQPRALKPNLCAELERQGPDDRRQAPRRQLRR